MRCRKCGNRCGSPALLCRACIDATPQRACWECGAATRLTVCEACQEKLYGEVVISEQFLPAAWVVAQLEAEGEEAAHG